jgi:hypothetical protein
VAALTGFGALAQQSAGPVATYWVSAATSTGFGAGLMGGGRPSASAMMGMMMGRGPDPNAVQHLLTLQLGSREHPQGAPQAEHLPPQALGVGPSLPLVTPVERAGPVTEGPSETTPMERPRGRMLIYWGCGEHAPPGQPQVIDFSKIGPNMPMPQFTGVQVNVEQPPSQGRSVTYGHWPNEKNDTPIPATGSLVGPHVVRGDYTPEIHFNLRPGQDFMPALRLVNAGKSPAGATQLTWTPLQQATGYFLMLMGANGRGGNSTDVVFWSSSRVRAGMMGGGLMDYLPPGEVRRLVAQGAVLPPQTGQCAVPAEVTSAAPMGMLSMIAYGDEANFADPPRPPRGPWNLRWTTKVRFKSTANMMLGMPAMGGADEEGAPPDAAQAQQQQQQQKKPRRPGLGDILGGFIPHP